MTSSHAGRTARYLAQYWRNAYTIRARGLTLSPVTSNKVIELAAYAKWQEEDWTLNFKANHGLALYQIIDRNGEEISKILREIKEDSDMAQDKLQELYDKAQKLEYEANAASDLLEMLSG